MATHPAKAICVYVLKALKPGPVRTYAGYTVCLKDRIQAHNGIKAGGAKSTSGFNWTPYFAVTGFRSKKEAMSFEWYLKYATNPRNRNPVPFSSIDNDLGRKLKLSPCQRRVVALWRVFRQESGKWNVVEETATLMEKIDLNRSTLKKTPTDMTCPEAALTRGSDIKSRSLILQLQCEQTILLEKGRENAVVESEKALPSMRRWCVHWSSLAQAETKALQGAGCQDPTLAVAWGDPAKVVVDHIEMDLERMSA